MLDIIANFFIFISALAKGTPDDLDIEDNIIELRAMAWFEALYQEHETAFKKNSDVRHIIGNVKVKKIINNPKRATKFKMKVLKAMSIKNLH